MENEKRLDLIDRNAIVTLMCRACNNECCEDPCEPGECFMYDTLTNVPTVDAVEVVHAMWIVVDDGVLIGKGTHFECSECGTRESWGRLSKYCPNCGAKMDGGNEDG